MVILSLDTSIVKCGFAVYDGKRVLRSGVIETNAKDRMSKRLFDIVEDIKTILGSKEYMVTHSVMEVKDPHGYNRSSNEHGKLKNLDSLLKNSEAAGAIKYLLESWGLPPFEVTPKMWKGNRNKKLDILLASQTVGHKVSDDIADAIQIAKWYHIRFGFLKGKEIG